MSTRRDLSGSKHVTGVALRELNIVVMLDTSKRMASVNASRKGCCESIRPEICRQVNDLAQYSPQFTLVTCGEAPFISDADEKYIGELLERDMYKGGVDMATAIRDVALAAETLKEDTVALVYTAGVVNVSETYEALRKVSRRFFPTKLSFVFVGIYAADTKEFFDGIAAQKFANACAVSVQEVSRLSIAQIAGLVRLQN